MLDNNKKQDKKVAFEDKKERREEEKKKARLKSVKCKLVGQLELFEFTVKYEKTLE